MPVEHLGLDVVLDARSSDAVGRLPDEVVGLARNHVIASLAATCEAGVDLDAEELLVDVDCSSKFLSRPSCVCPCLLLSRGRGMWALARGPNPVLMMLKGLHKAACNVYLGIRSSREPETFAAVEHLKIETKTRNKKVA